MTYVERDLDTNPYTKDEIRVCEYLTEITNGAVGCGDNPIGFLIASHNYAMHEIKEYKQQLNVIINVLKRSIDLTSWVSNEDQKYFEKTIFDGQCGRIRLDAVQQLVEEAKNALKTLE